MTKRIFKYVLNVEQKQFLMLPKGAEILTVQEQRNNPRLWALVNEENELEERCFEIFGTGHEIHYDMGVDRKYIGTFQTCNGQFVFHVFERIN